jgi:hypothetical protein
MELVRGGMGLGGELMVFELVVVESWWVTEDGGAECGDN